MRSLPNCYSANSTYALFPFSTPETVRKILTSFEGDVVSRYDFTRPSPSTQTKPIHSVKTYKACLDVLADPRRFGTVYDKSIKNCSNEYGYFIAQEGNDHKVNRQLQATALFPTGWQDDLKEFYRTKTAELIKAKSWSYDGGKTFTLDVVRDVTNVSRLFFSFFFPLLTFLTAPTQLTAVYWCSHQFGIPLKGTSEISGQSAHGLFTPQELYLILSAFFISVFMNFDLAAGFKLSAAAKKAAPALLAVIKLRISQVKGVPVRLSFLPLPLYVFADVRRRCSGFRGPRNPPSPRPSRRQEHRRTRSRRRFSRLLHPPTRECR
jgi:hypothetical protein